VAARLYTGMKLADRHRPVANLVISNVPGPDFPLYMGGSQMLGMFPLGPVMDGMGLNITIMSYLGVLYWGLASDARAVPRLWDIAAAIPHALTELMEAAGLESEPFDVPIHLGPGMPPTATGSAQLPRRSDSRGRRPARHDRARAGPPGALRARRGASATFYRDVLGWRQILPEAGEVPTGGPPPSPRGAPITSCSSLRWVDATPDPGRGAGSGCTTSASTSARPTTTCAPCWPRCRPRAPPLSGASDHTVTHSLYIEDPDGNEIELYVDVPGVDWKSNPTLIGAPIRPLSALRAVHNSERAVGRLDRGEEGDAVRHVAHLGPHSLAHSAGVPQMARASTRSSGMWAPSSPSALTDQAGQLACSSPRPSASSTGR
jgi:catechol 2,3-dioxygenase